MLGGWGGIVPLYVFLDVLIKTECNIHSGRGPALNTLTPNNKSKEPPTRNQKVMTPNFGPGGVWRQIG